MSTISSLLKHRQPKSAWVIIFLLPLLAAILACNSLTPETPTPEVFPTPEPTSTDITPSPTNPPPTNTPEPSATPAPPTNTPTLEPTPVPTLEHVTVGLILDTSKDDDGWGTQHFKGVQYLVANMPEASLLLFENLNPATTPGVTLEQVVNNFAQQGANLIFLASRDFASQSNDIAALYPNIVFIQINGDAALTGDAPFNLGNLMGRMEYGQMMAGCAAALASRTGSIGYVGSVVNNESYRYVNAAFLGANHCWQVVRSQPTPLKFSVNWVGGLLNIPGVTADPTVLATNFYNSGSDVVISGLDSEDVLYVAQQRFGVFAVPYNTTTTCPFTTVCLGLPYFNWGPAYLEIARQVQQGIWEQSWLYVDPDWTSLADTQNNIVQWTNGPALLPDAQTQLATFMSGLGDASINLYLGQLKYANGTTWVAIGETASAEKIWFTDQLLTGIIDLSTQPTPVPQ